MASTKKEAKQTPMMQQFYQIKNQHPDKILFYRMGDFYEMFGDDAVKAAKILQIQLTTRNKNKENAIPMCGLPFHAYEQYLNKLTSAGYKVAICEQIEDPATAQGIVKRDVVRIVTPGTVLATDLLDATSNSFLCALFGDLRRNIIGIAFCDLSTGEFEIEEINIKSGWDRVLELMFRYQPREVILPRSPREKESQFYQEFTKNSRKVIFSTAKEPLIEFLDHYHFEKKRTTKLLKEHFSIGSLAGFGIDNLPAATSAAGAVLYYLQETQKDALCHITTIRRIPQDEVMLMDESTVRNLELFQTSDGLSKQYTLLGQMDNTQTPMGARMLRRWLSAPLIQKKIIEKRLNSVEAFIQDSGLALKIREFFGEIGDLERIITRIALPSANISDLVKFRSSLAPLAHLKKLFTTVSNTYLQALIDNFDDLKELHSLLSSNILEDPKVKISEGGFIAQGVNDRLDQLKHLMKNGKQMIANMEAEEKKKTEIGSLKIGYNRVFGYFIEVSNTFKNKVPTHYIRKQTLVNSERYVTEELKELEEDILSAEDESNDLEHKLFNEIRFKLQSEINRIQKTSRMLAEIDVLSTFAFNATSCNYTKPEFYDTPAQRVIDIKQGRHPVIESIHLDEPFIPNDVYLNSSEHFITVITGPNMGGKSTYMRQAALIALMAQVGSYVPAEYARLSVFDRIFTRVGASDNLTRGQSTFMVEMSEAASILNNASSQSLIILDEIGRGTSTFDGISIAWSIIEYLHKTEALTLFATHYHELILLADQLKGVKNAEVVVKEENDSIVFLRKVIDGKADKSYGIQVAKLAGLPEEVIQCASDILNNLEKAERSFSTLENKNVAPMPDRVQEENQQISFLEPELPWVEELRNFNLNHKTPIQAMEFLYQLQQKI